jgi:hypothetical protein
MRFECDGLAIDCLELVRCTKMKPLSTQPTTAQSLGALLKSARDINRKG